MIRAYSLVVKVTLLSMLASKEHWLIFLVGYPTMTYYHFSHRTSKHIKVVTQLILSFTGQSLENLQQLKSCVAARIVESAAFDHVISITWLVHVRESCRLSFRSSMSSSSIFLLHLLPQIRWNGVSCEDRVIGPNWNWCCGYLRSTRRNFSCPNLLQALRANARDLH